MALFQKKKRKGAPEDESGALTPAIAHGGTGKALDELYPAFREAENTGQSRMVDLPTASSGYFGGSDGLIGSDGRVYDQFGGSVAISSDETEVDHGLPVERVARYGVLDIMAQDPTVDCAMKAHLCHALSAKADTGEIVGFESLTDDTDPIVQDLRASLTDIVHKELHEWAYGAGVHGVHYARVYGEPGVGIKLLRSDYYTHPRFMREYERAGQLVGYVNAHQGAIAKKGQISLMPPWSFVAFKIPHWQVASQVEPFRVDAKPIDIEVDDYSGESICETQDYGTSMISTGYGPWMDLQESIASMNMSRKNAARLERIIGVNTGRLDPRKASEFTRQIADQMRSTAQQAAKQSLRRGYVQTVINRILPILGDSKGRLDINSVQGTPDISAIVDIDFHVKRLGGALGVDPALLGFGEMLSGGLGDGGFFRVSVMAAMKAQLLRRAILNGLERLCEIHVAYKFGKIFLPGEKPWRLTFNSVSTAVEREEQENKESKANLAGTIAGIQATLDPEWQATDRRAYLNFLYTHIMGVDEPTFMEVCPKGFKPPAPQTPPGGEGGGGMFESATGGGDGELPPLVREKIYNLLEEFHHG